MTVLLNGPIIHDSVISSTLLFFAPVDYVNSHSISITYVTLKPIFLIWLSLIYIRHGVNFILSIPIPHQIYQFQMYQFQFRFTYYFLPRVGTLSIYLESLLRVIYIPSRIAIEEIFLK